MNTRRKLWVTAVALLVGLGTVEAGVRIAFADEVDTAHIRQRQSAGHFGHLIRYVEDPLLYYELAPDLNTTFHGHRVLTDSDGVRVRLEPRAPGPSGEPLRVAVVGASSTFGFRLSLEDTWPERLAGMLEAAWGRAVELRNVSVPGYNSEQQAHQFETRVLPWEPDLVLWHYDHRDAFPPLVQDQPAEIAPEFGDNRLHSAALKLLLRRLHARELERHRFEGEAPDSCDDYFVSGRFYERHLAALQRVGTLARARDIPVVLVLFDAFVRRLPAGADHHARLHVPLVDTLERAGFTVLDLYAEYQDVMIARDWKDLRQWWLSIDPLDGHPNEACHVWLAERIGALMLDHPRLAPFTER